MIFKNWNKLYASKNIDSELIKLELWKKLVLIHTFGWTTIEFQKLQLKDYDIIKFMIEAGEYDIDFYSL